MGKPMIKDEGRAPVTVLLCVFTVGALFFSQLNKAGILQEVPFNCQSR